MSKGRNYRHQSQAVKRRKKINTEPHGNFKQLFIVRLIKWNTIKTISFYKILFYMISNAYYYVEKKFFCFVSSEWHVNIINIIFIFEILSNMTVDSLLIFTAFNSIMLLFHSLRNAYIQSVLQLLWIFYTTETQLICLSFFWH